MFTSEKVSSSPGDFRHAPHVLAAVAVGVLYGLCALPIVGHGRVGEIVVAASTREVLQVIVGVVGWGLPAVIGVYAALVTRRTTTSAVLFAFELCAVAMLAAAPLVQEGAICYIVAVPWYLVVSGVLSAVGALVLGRIDRKAAAASLMVVIAAFTVLVFPRARAQEELVDEIVVALPRAEVYASMEHLALPLEADTPTWIKMLLPRPLRIDGGGATRGAERRVIFANGVLCATVTDAVAPERFGLRLEVESSGAEFFDHWLTFGASEFRFEALDAGHTRVVHATRYTPVPRMLALFAPLERRLGHAIQGGLLAAYARSMSRASREDEAAQPQARR